jgi:hypothetical protein
MSVEDILYVTHHIDDFLLQNTNFPDIFADYHNLNYDEIILVNLINELRNSTNTFKHKIIDDIVSKACTQIYCNRYRELKHHPNCEEERKKLGDFYAFITKFYEWLDNNLP